MFRTHHGARAGCLHAGTSPWPPVPAFEQVLLPDNNRIEVCYTLTSKHQQAQPQGPDPQKCEAGRRMATYAHSAVSAVPQ